MQPQHRRIENKSSRMVCTYNDSEEALNRTSWRETEQVHGSKTTISATQMYVLGVDMCTI